MTECPDIPREWDPNHPTLTAADAPHETAGLMRIHRAGHPGADIMKAMKIKVMDLTKALNQAMDDEQEASRRGVAIHDEVIAQ